MYDDLRASMVMVESAPNHVDNSQVQYTTCNK